MTLSQKLMKEGEGILRLKPTWVPRAFCRPGKRIKLHPDDYYSCRPEHGAIEVRFMASVIKGGNDEYAEWDEGLSYITLDGIDPENKFLFKDALLVGIRKIYRTLRAFRVGEAAHRHRRSNLRFGEFQ